VEEFQGRAGRELAWRLIHEDGSNAELARLRNELKAEPDHQLRMEGCRMWFADKLGPAPKGSPLARANGQAKAETPAKGAKNAAPLRAASPKPSRPAPEPEKKKKGWF